MKSSTPLPPPSVPQVDHQGPTIHEQELRMCNAILALLTDDEVKCLAGVEAGPPLTVGAEYIDLLHPQRGICLASERGDFNTTDVLPRTAVHENTWRQICVLLASQPFGLPMH